MQHQNAVPIEFTVNDWNHIMHVNITPVFIESQSRARPVIRCPNHTKSERGKKCVTSESLDFNVFSI